MLERQLIRCSDGHLYSATWIPLVCWRSVRLGYGRRLDRCPVGRHWRMAEVVDPGDLTEAEREQAERRYSGVR